VDLRPRGVAAFDFDGTLVRGDSLPKFLVQLLGRRRFARILACSGPSMLGGYCGSGRDGSKSALLMRALGGVAADHAEGTGEAFAHFLVDQIRPEMRRCLAWHHSQDHQRILVSAALAIYLEPFGRLIGLDHVIATRLEVGEDGRLTGCIEGCNVRSAQKALRLAEMLGSEPVEMWAYGDSSGDREMLAMADHPVWARSRRLAVRDVG
jgi:phosphatidylglycerophosphatase C